MYTCDVCGDQDLTWKKFYEEYLQLFRKKENWDNKKDQISCIIGFFCHMYEKTYNTPYIFVPKNRNPYGAKECRDAWSLLSAFNGNAHNVRKYIHWFFTKGMNKNTTITSFGYINIPGLIRKYNLYSKRKHVLKRESKLPKKFIDWCKENTPSILDNYSMETMNDLGAMLGFLDHYSDSMALKHDCDEYLLIEKAMSLNLVRKDGTLNIGR